MTGLIIFGIGAVLYGLLLVYIYGRRKGEC
jgi:hypothetical protein